jgi:hypothetical protein
MRPYNVGLTVPVDWAALIYRTGIGFVSICPNAVPEQTRTERIVKEYTPIAVKLLILFMMEYGSLTVAIDCTIPSIGDTAKYGVVMNGRSQRL